MDKTIIVYHLVSFVRVQYEHTYIHKLNIVFLCTSMHDDHEYSCCNCILVMFRVKAVKCTDRRVRGMTDILSGIKVLKMYAWENVFKKMIFNIRRSVIYSTCRAT